MTPTAPTTLAGAGIRIDLPLGWEGRIYRRPGGMPILHAASCPLPQGDGDFGSLAVAHAGSDGVFVAMIEYGQESVGAGLFADHGVPTRIRAAELSPKALQRRIAGRAGIQRFFTQTNRAFCLYVVAGTGASRALAEANRALGSIVVDGP